MEKLINIYSLLQKKIFVSYQELEGIPEKYINKVVKIGNLVREEIINNRTSIMKKINLTNLRY